MRVAVTVWEDSVSTVCDFCNRVLIFDIEAGEAKNPLPLAFETHMWPARVNQLKAAGVGVLLCGALSRPLERLLATAGIQVIAGLCGSVEDIMKAYLDGALCNARFTLPGFVPEANRLGGPRRRRCGRRSGPGPWGGAGPRSSAGSIRDRKSET